MAPQSTATVTAPMQTTAQSAKGEKLFQVDLDAPQVFLVGHLLDRYDDWVHQPIVSKNGPRLFASDFLEMFTKTHWWVIPLVWVPVAITAEYFALARGLAPVFIPYLMMLGLVIWTVLEYTLHRLLFHWTTTTYWTNTLHYLLHGCHHKHPQDRYRLVMPPLLFAVLSSIVTYPFFVLIPAHSIVWATYGGAILGYVMYDMTHYWTHFGSPAPFEALYALRKYHMAHHFRDYNAGFGITSPIWDMVFGTTFANSPKEMASK